MNQNDKSEIRDEINRRISEVKEKINKLEELTKPIAPDVAIGRLTRMEAINEKSINEASLRDSKETLIKLEQALINLENSDFGNCLICKKEIPKVRILRVPESNRCVNCSGKTAL